MIKAVYSAQAGIAITLVGDDAKLISVHEDNFKMVERDYASRYFDGACDVKQDEFHDEKDLLGVLKKSYSKDQSLFFTLSLFDSTYENSLKLDILEVLEEYLGDGECFDFVLKRVLSSCGLSFDEFNSKDAAGFHNVEKLLHELQRFSSVALKLKSEWDEISLVLFGNIERKNYILSELIRRGLFGSVILNYNDPVNYNLQIYSLWEALGKRKNGYEIIEAWLKSKPTEAIPRNLFDEYSLKEKDNDASAKANESSVYKVKKTMKSIKETFENVNTQIEKIEDLIKQGDIGLAKRYIDNLREQQLESQQDSAFAAKSLCRVASRARKYTYYEFELDLCQEAVRIMPSDGWCHGQLGDAYINNSRLDEALVSFKEAIAFGSECFGRGGVARVYKMLGNYTEALKELEIAIKSGSADDQIYYLKADLFREKFDFSKSIEIYKYAIEIFSDCTNLMNGLGSIYRSMGNYSESRVILEHALLLEPTNEKLLCSFADLFIEEENFDGAFELYDRCIKVNDGSEIAIAGKVEVYKRTKRYEAAYKLLKQHLDIFPNSLRLRFSHAELLRFEGDLIKAEQEYVRLIRMFPKEVFIVNGYANILKRKKKFEDSLAQYDKNISNFPHSSVAMHGRADLLKELGSYDNAILAYDEIIRKDSDAYSRNRAVSSKVSILLSQGKADIAFELIPTGNKLENKNDWYLYFLKGLCFLALKDYSKAKKYFLNGRDNVPFSDIKKKFVSSLVSLALEVKDYKKAKKLLRGEESILGRVQAIHLSILNSNNDKAKQILNDSSTQFDAFILKDFKAKFDQLVMLEPSSDIRESMLISEFQVMSGDFEIPIAA